MSHLRAPAARADRREGGRHGRSAPRAVPSLPEIHIRPQLLRLAVLPATAVALSACAAVLFTFRAGGARPSLTLWAVLAGAAAVALAGIVIAAVAATRTAKSVRERLGALRQVSTRSADDLRDLVDALRRGDQPPACGPRLKPAAGADDFELLTADLTRAHDSAVTAVVQASQLSSQAGSEQKLEVFVNLARRLQSLVQREISILDDLENEIEDPDLLKGLFHVDHLATRIRRHAENLAVLGGAVSRRQWSNPVSMTEVLRSAIAEVEQYSRVKLVPPVDGTLRGHAVADVIHLLAELVENATVFSAPHTQVLLRANLVTSGLAVEVEDRGLGMPVTEQNKMNALLADPDQVNVASLLQDGRIGLFVVSQLARRHGIQVRLQTNIYGGVQAAFVVPQGLLGAEPGDLPQHQPHTGQSTGQGNGQGNGQSTGVRRSDAPRHMQSVTPQRVPGPGTGPSDRATTERPGRTATGRSTPGPTRASVPRQQGPGRGGERQGAGRGGSGPTPLPVRGVRDERPNPAEAVPGIRPDDRGTVADNAGTPPTPRVGGAVRGTMGRPQLPRRRAQQHIVPQLRGGPVPTPRQDPDHYVGHDPGLMAAFQRGIGLAEARQMENSDWDTSSLDTTSADLTTPPAPDAASRIDTGQLDTGRLNMGRLDTGGLDSDGLNSGLSRAGWPEVGGREESRLDSGCPETGRRRPDEGRSDTGGLDAGGLNSGRSDAGWSDAGALDVDGLDVDGLGVEGLGVDGLDSRRPEVGRREPGGSGTAGLDTRGVNSARSAAGWPEADGSDEGRLDMGRLEGLRPAPGPSDTGLRNIVHPRTGGPDAGGQGTGGQGAGGQGVGGQSGGRADAGRPASAAYRGVVHADAFRRESAHLDAPHLDTPREDGIREDGTRSLGGRPTGGAPIAVPPSGVDGARDLTLRQDGSSPAG